MRILIDPTLASELPASPANLGPLGLFVLLGLAGVLTWTAAVWYTYQRLTSPHRRGIGYAVYKGLPQSPADLPNSAGSAPLRFSLWEHVTTRGESLPVFDIQGGDSTGPIVVLCHGWGGSRFTMWARVSTHLPRASRILSLDLPGHGDTSRRSRSALGMTEPAELCALLSKLLPHHESSVMPVAVPPALVLHGFSLGAGVCIAAAAARSGLAPALVIAEAPYRLPQTPASAVMAEAGLPRTGSLRAAIWLAALRAGASGPQIVRAGGSFDRAQFASKVTCPLLVIHGERDTICPAADGREIAQAAPRGHFVQIEGAGHQDLWDEPFAPHTTAAVYAALERLTSAR